MCGIAGYITALPERNESRILKAMTDVIAHRGPDGEGHWISDDGRTGLGHRRLSILDLSTDGAQPMHYGEGRYIIVFNGEIYNYIELRDQLLAKGYVFRSTSDTEVLLAMYDCYREKCLGQLDGMFAFVIYDQQTRQLFGARDRFGEKPFFYAYEPGKNFLFGSELKTLWAAGIPKQVSDFMLARYLESGATIHPAQPTATFYKDCFQLPHSHYFTLDADTLELHISRYFDIDWRSTNHQITEQEAVATLRNLFYQSVTRRLRSDVPVGSSLSGGLDSSLVVTVIDRIKGEEQLQKTFSAVFPGFEKDERRYIDFVLQKAHVQPYFVTPDDAGLLADFEKLCYHQDEPFGSASIYVQYRVMQLAHESSVTVLLDGQGADEILAGYHFYYHSFFEELAARQPQRYREEYEAYQKVHASNTINARIQGRGSGWKARLSRQAGLKKLYRKLVPASPDASVLEPAFRKKHFAENTLPEPATLNEALYQSTMHGDLQTLLRYADRNSMAHSREVRLPFLSHELVEFLFSLPPHFKIRQGWTKWLMREAFPEELPLEIAWRTDKIGYEPPQANWMQAPAIREQIHAAREQLVHNRVLRADAPGEPRLDWRLFMLAQALSKSAKNHPSFI